MMSTWVRLQQLGLVITMECKIRACGPAPIGNYLNAQFENGYDIYIFGNANTSMHHY